MSKRVYNPNTCPYCSQIIDNSERQIHLDKCKKFKKSRTIKSKRYLQFVQYFLGKEKGLEFFKNRNNKSRSDLKYLKFLYGKEEGQIRYDRNKYMLSIKGRIEYYIEKFGPIEGPIKYKEKNSKLSVGVDVLRKAGKTEEEIVEIKKTHGKKSGINYENMLRVHKDPQVALDKLITFRDGIKGRAFTTEWWMEKKGMSYEDAHAKMLSIQRKDLNYYVKKYGNTLGTEKYFEMCRKKGVNSNLDELEKKYGKDHLNEILSRRNGRKSNAQINFCKKIHALLPEELKEKIQGEPFSQPKRVITTTDEQDILNQKVIIPDIVIGNIIIEYDGFFHDTENTITKDSKKDIIYKNRGYKILRIDEKQYKKNKQHTLEKTIKFILENYEDKID